MKTKVVQHDRTACAAFPFTKDVPQLQQQTMPAVNNKASNGKRRIEGPGKNAFLQRWHMGES